MGYRLSKIVTRKGDDGTTSLDGKHRLDKDSIQIESLGTIDELNSLLGMVIAFGMQKAYQDVFLQIQQDLFNLGGELCPPHREAITADKVHQLEQWIEEWNKTLSPLKEFILPGGNPTSACCHVARTVCRRAERCLVGLNKLQKMNKQILRYINRLSDLLFVAARILAADTHSKEILWDHEKTHGK